MDKCLSLKVTLPSASPQGDAIRAGECRNPVASALKDVQSNVTFSRLLEEKDLDVPANVNQKRWQKQINRAKKQENKKKNRNIELKMRRNRDPIDRFGVTSEYVAEALFGCEVSMQPEQFDVINNLFGIFKDMTISSNTLANTSKEIGKGVFRGVIDEAVNTAGDSLVKVLEAVFGKHYKVGWIVFACAASYWCMSDMWESRLVKLTTMTALCLATYRVVGTEIFSEVYSKVKDWTTGYKAESLSDDVMNPEAVGQGILFAVLCYLFPANGMSLKGIATTFKGFSYLKRDIVSISEFFINVIKSAVNKTCEFFNVDFALRTNVAPEIDAWIDECRKFARRINNGELEVTRDNFDALVSLEEKGLTLLSRYRATHLGRELGNIMMRPMNELTSIRKDLEGRGVFSSKLRQPPTVALFMGESTVGKSFALRNVVAYLLTRIYPEKAEHIKTNLDEYTYSRMFEQIFWDGYYGQEVCFFDELGMSLPDHLTADNVHANNVRCGNVFNYPLHMASLEQKGTTYFRSKIMISTGNMKDPAIDAAKALAYPEASVNRFHFVATVTVKKEYCTEASVNNEPRYRVLDKTKLDGLGFNWDVHEYRLQFRRRREGTTDQFEWVLSNEVLDTVQMAELMYDKYMYNKRLACSMIQDDVRACEKAMEENFRRGYVAESGVVDEIQDEVQCEYESRYAMPSVKVMKDWMELVKRPEDKQLSELQNLVVGFRNSMTADQNKNITILFKKLQDIEKAHHVPSFAAPVVLVALLSHPVYSIAIEDCPPDELQKIMDAQEVEQKSIFNLEVVKRNLLDVCMRLRLCITRCLKSLSDVVSENMFGIVFVFACGTALAGVLAVIKFIWNVLSGFFSKETKKEKEVEFVSESDPGLDNTIKKVWKNYYTVNCNGKMLGYGFFLNGRNFAMPMHFLDVLNHMDCENVVLSHVTCDRDIVATFDEIKNSCGPFSDDGIMCIISSANIHSDIRSQMTAEPNFLQRTRGELVLVRRDDMGTVLEKVPFTTSYGVSYQGVGGTVSTLPVAVRYMASTVNGDCGSPLFLVDQSCRNQRFLGFHVAGTINKAVNAAGIGCIFKQQHVSEGACDNLITMKVVRKLERAPGIATHTKIRASKMHGDWGPALKRPAALTSRIVDGVLQHPLANAIRKYDKEPPQNDPELINLCADNMVSALFTGAPVEQFTRVSVDEATFGIDGMDYMDGLNMSTSPGYPWNVQHSQFPGKERFFEQVDSKWHWRNNADANALRNEIEHTIECLKAGKRVEFLFTGSLKDELRPHKKVDECNTRYFAACSILFNIVFNVFFKSLIPFLIKNRIFNGMLLGVNPYSEEWDVFARFLTEVGDRLIAGDFESFDAKQEKLILDTIGEKVFVLFDDLEYTGVRRLLWHAMTASSHIVGNTVVQWNHSMPSGCPWTTAANCMYVLVVFRMVWVISGEPLEQFTVNVRLGAYGDDNALAVSDYGARVFSQSKLPVLFARIGLTYTSEKKEGEVADFRKITEIEFLKRSFRYEPIVGRMVAPLRLETILEMPYWTKKKMSDVIACDNVDNAIRELALHPQDVFDEHVPKILASSARHYGYRPAQVNRKALILAMKDYVPRHLLKQEKYRAEAVSAETLNTKMLDLNGWERTNCATNSLDNVSSSESLVYLHRSPRVDSKTQGNALLPQRWVLLWENKGPSANVNESKTDDNNDGVFEGAKDNEGGTTAFLNDAQVSVTHVRATPEYLKGLDDSAVIGYDQGIKEFLEKPIRFVSGIWTSTGPGNILQTLDLEDYFQIPLVRNKLSGYVGVRGTFVVRLQFNATKFQQGRIVACFVPSADIGGMKPLMRIRSLMSATQLPRVELDLATDTSVSIEIPYISPTNYHNLITGQGPWGNLYFIVYGEKKAGSAPYDAAYTIFMSLENAEFVMPGFTVESGQSSSFKKRNVTDQEAKISTTFGAVTKSLNALNKVPILGAFAGTAAWVTDAMAGTAKAFGFSKPLVQIDVLKGMIDQTAGMANFNNADPGDMMGLDVQNKVDVLTTLGGAPDDEVAIAYVAQRSAYIGTLNWAATAPAGTVLSTYGMNPGAFRNPMIDGATAGQPYYDHTPLSFVSSFFLWWRGGIKFTLKFVKTPFHSGRLLVAFNPTNSVFNIDQTNYMIREVIDIRECVEYTFTVPYMSVKQYSATAPYHYSEGEEITGLLSIFVLNELNHPASVSSNIDILVEVAGGKDIEFAFPKSQPCEIYVPGIYAAESGGLTVDDPVLMGDHGLGSAIIDPGCIEPAQYCMGERVLSFYQLIKRFHFADNIGNASPGSTSLSFRPFTLPCASNTANVRYSAPSGTPLQLITACYAFSRGSLRMMLKFLATNSSATPIRAYMTNFQTNSSVLIYDTAPANRPMGLGHKLINFPDAVRVPNITVPSYNNLKARVNKLSTAAVTPIPDDYDSPVIVVVDPGNTNKIDMYYAAGDDYQLSYFIGVPPVWYNGAY